MTSQDMSHATAPDPEYVALYRRLRAEGGVELREQLHARYLDLARGGVTPGGLPYPDPTDPVAEGASAIRALAEALDPHVADTGWVDVSTAAGFAPMAGMERPQVRKRGDLIHFRGGWSSTGITASASFTVGILPVGFAPPLTVHGRAGTANGAGSASVRFEASGNVQIRTNATLSAYYFPVVPPWFRD